METGSDADQLTNQNSVNRSISNTKFSSFLRRKYNLLFNFTDEPLDKFVEGSLDLDPSDGMLIRLIYLHHEKAIYSNVFVDKILPMKTISECLCINFQFWGWNMDDQSYPANRFWATFENIFKRVPRSMAQDEMFPMLIGIRESTLDELLEFGLPYSYTILVQGSKLLLSNKDCSIENFKNDLDQFKADTMSAATRRKNFIDLFPPESSRQSLINELSNKSLYEIVSQYSMKAFIWMTENKAPLYLNDLSASMTGKALKYFQDKSVETISLNLFEICHKHDLCNCYEVPSNARPTSNGIRPENNLWNYSFSSLPHLRNLIVNIDGRRSSYDIYRLLVRLPANITNLHVRCSDFMCYHHFRDFFEVHIPNLSLKSFIFDFENFPIPLSEKCCRQIWPCFLKICVSLLSCMKALRIFRLIIHKHYFEEIIHGIEEFQEIIEKCFELKEISIQINEEINETEAELISDIQNQLNTIRPIVFQVLQR